MCVDIDKDTSLPLMYTQLRNTLTEAGWVVSHSDPQDTYVVFEAPCHPVACIIHYMPEAATVYPNGSFLLKLRCSEETWKIATDTYPINKDTALIFMHKMNKLVAIHDIVKHEIHKDPF